MTESFEADDPSWWRIQSGIPPLYIGVAPQLSFIITFEGVSVELGLPEQQTSSGAARSASQY
ncbi:hypothetical protein EPN29_10125 [bacterium]|nr:MAG: hypothetical protein EPN29_10125 [bacterium]